MSEVVSAVQSFFHYDFKKWANSLSSEIYVNRPAQVQGLVSLRNASEPTLLVIAVVIPIALCAAELRIIYLRESKGNREAVACEERAHALYTWQES